MHTSINNTQTHIKWIEREKNKIKIKLQLEKIICRTLIFNNNVALASRWIFLNVQHSSCVCTQCDNFLQCIQFACWCCMQTIKYIINKLCPCEWVCVTVGYLRVYCVIYVCDLKITSELVVCLWGRQQQRQQKKVTQVSRVLIFLFCSRAF